jgi:formate-dependent nitrite reductase membrane component NrfD
MVTPALELGVLRVGLIVFLAAFAAFGFVAAHYLEVRGAAKAAAFFLVLARIVLVLMIVLVLLSTCIGPTPTD